MNKNSPFNISQNLDASIPYCKRKKVPYSLSLLKPISKHCHPALKFTAQNVCLGRFRYHFLKLSLYVSLLVFNL